MKTTCTGKTSISFDNHQVTLQSSEAEINIRFKDRAHFDAIAIGSDVEVSIGKKKAKAAKAPKAKK